MDKTVTMHSCQCLVHSAVADYHIRKPLYGKILQMLGFHLALILSNLNKQLPHNNCFKTSVPNIETVLSITVVVESEALRLTLCQYIYIYTITPGIA